jgi:hypothetical protein
MRPLPPIVVLACDIQMNAMDGYKRAEKDQKMRPSLPVILASVDLALIRKPFALHLLA